MFAVIAVAVLAPLATVARATERRPLPDFTLAGLDGAETPSGALAMDSTWLLVYVRADCAACATLLGHIDSDERPRAGRIVVVIGGSTAAQARDIAAKHANMSATRWFADADGAAGRALRVDGLPAVLGLRAARIEWGFTGLLRRPADLESMLFGWLERQ